MQGWHHVAQISMMATLPFRSAAFVVPPAMFSRSMEEIHSPPDLMTSFLRSMMRMKPNSSSVAMSPQDSLKQIVVDPGLKVELVASEPNIYGI